MTQISLQSPHRLHRSGAGLALLLTAAFMVVLDFSIVNVALAAIERENFDVVLMDVQMPEMDGFEATAAIRAQERDSGKHLPIIAMTAHAMAGDRERCLAAGMDNYIAKPINARALIEVLQQFSDAAREQASPA